MLLLDFPQGLEILLETMISYFGSSAFRECRNPCGVKSLCGMLSVIERMPVSYV
jgi:hypothetical protein